MAKQDSPLILFDLGGVVVEFSGLADMHSLLRSPMDQGTLAERFGASEAIAAFETSELTPEQFGAAFCAGWDLTCSESEFLTHYESWTRALLPGAHELLSELGDRYRIAALSNSNVLHWTRNDVVIGVQSYFERAFSSHEMGVRKPDVRAFQHALSELGVTPESVVFLDDNHGNVSAASSLGIQAYWVEGPAAARRQLEALGLL